MNNTSRMSNELLQTPMNTRIQNYEIDDVIPLRRMYTGVGPVNIINIQPVNLLDQFNEADNIVHGNVTHDHVVEAVQLFPETEEMNDNIKPSSL